MLMKTSAYFLSLFFILLLCTQCRKKEDDTPWQKCEYLSANIDTIKMYLPGTWELVEYYTIGWSGPSTIDTPKTLGYVDYITIDGDLIYFRRFPGNEIKRYKYKVEQEKDFAGWGSDDYPVIGLYDMNWKPDHCIDIRICANSLMFLNSGMTDGAPDITFKKIN